MANASKLWASAFAGPSMPFAAADGPLKGGYDALNGNGGLALRYSKTAERIVEAAEESGVENGAALMTALISIAATGK